jgi:hypothetical protein
MLFRELSEAFTAGHSVPTKEEDVMSTENDLLYGTKAIANFLEASRQKYQDLIVVNAIPTFSMLGSATRCARKSALNARWLAPEDAATTAQTVPMAAIDRRGRSQLGPNPN